MPFNKPQFIRAQNQAAQTYNEAAILPEEITQRLLEYLDSLVIRPTLILDLGCKTGYSSRLLQKKFPDAKIISVDVTEEILAITEPPSLVKACVDPEALPFLNNSFDLVFSNLVLPWFNFEKIFQEVYRVLKMKSFFLFSTFGPDTLLEMRQSWQEIDNEIHVNNFIDMHLLGDELLRVHFTNPVMTMELLILMFTQVTALLHHLRGLGYKNFEKKQLNHLLGKKHFQKFLNVYQQNYQDQNKEIPATFEVIYGYGEKTAVTFINEVGEINIPISLIKK